MKKYIGAIICFAFCYSASCQSYSISPSKIFKKQIDADGGFYSFDVFIKNETSKPLKICWVKTVESFPTGWDHSICDYGICYTTVPDSSKMAAIAPGAEGYMKLDILPMGIAGTCKMFFYIRDSADASNNDTIGFEITAVIGNGVSDQQPASFSTYPNPVLNQLYINANIVGFAQYALTDMLGRRVAFGNVKYNEPIEVSGLEKGIYHITLTEMNGQQKVQRFIKQ